MSTTPPPAKKLWGGAFTNVANDPHFDEMNASIGYDKALWAADLHGSQAYARALGKAGVIDEHQAAKMAEGLAQVKEEWSSGAFVIVPASDEDIHTANERRLGELVGSDVAGRLHTGRSRNDQVATDMKLWLRREAFVLRGELRQLIQTAHDHAAEEQSLNALLPGYTHLQRAQPIRWSHWALSLAAAHAWAWTRDAERLDDLARRADACPLGSGALAGHPFFGHTDREALGAELGFGSVTQNSLDAVSDRDFCIEFAQFGALLGAHLSRWAQDLIIYGTKEFGYVKFGEAYSTGSSLMPQKRNPDALELLRAKSGRLQAQAQRLTSLISALPSTYNKDLQEDKEAVFDVAKTLRLAIPVAAGCLRTLTLHTDKMRAALSPEMLATDLAEHLVRRGVPFRETHHVAGAAVRLAEANGKTLATLSKAELVSLHPSFEGNTEAELAAIWDYDRSVESRDATGGTSKRAQLQQLAALKAWIAKTEHNGPTPESVAWAN
ncbi:L-Aspartase-like protein [Pelagophyceae sp. CCMP2097]|nr:L-Aspartase-like protein [Pelagophyceae sp. CCMP2097]